MNDFGTASAFDKDSVLRFLLYHIDQDLREHLRNEMPLAYNRLYNREIMVVHSALAAAKGAST
jgi:hypothetical protein